MRPTASALALAVVAVLLSAGTAPAAVWTLNDHPPPPPGAEFKVPLGAPGDLQFFAPNRGLLAIEGNSAVKRGLYRYNGESWAPLSTVCGGPGDTTRIAWAGPREFWTVTEPSLPRSGSGLALCRFRDGEVVASYSTPEQSADPYRRMNAATCRAENDCWFGGLHTVDPSGEREGAFLLHWDGVGLSTVYYRQGRGISDLEGHAGGTWLSTVVGRQVDSRQEPPRLERPEDRPHLLHRVEGRAFTRDPFTAADLADPDPLDGEDPPDDATDLLALDGDGTRLWTVGGGTTTGAAPEDPEGPTGRDMYDRQPIAALLEPGGAFEELTLDRAFDPGERFVDVAAVPGTNEAWVAVQRFLDRRSTSARAKVARIDATGKVQEVVALPTSGAGRGAAARIAFTSPTDGWVVTTAGWLLHFSDGSRPPRDDDPAFNRLIDFRPNEAAAQFVPDAPPADDSQLFAPPPVEIVQAPTAATAAAAAPRQLPALLRNVKSRLKGRRRLVISFRLVREARIGVVGRRGKKVVARAKVRTLKPGNRRIVVKLDPKRYPTRISFSIAEAGATAPAAGGGNDTGAGTGDTVTTGGGPVKNDETVTTGGRR